MAIFSVIISLGPLALRLLGWFPPNGHPAVLMILFTTQMIAIMLGVCTNVLVYSMLADVVEDEELRTGRRSEGVVLAANTFAQKCVTGVGVFLSGLMVAAVHFPRHAAPGEIDPAIPNRLVLLYM